MDTSAETKYSSSDESAPSLRPNFALNNLSLSLASTTVSHIGLSSVSRLSLPKTSSRSTRRPSTASSAEEKSSMLLPSSSSAVDSSSRGSTPNNNSPAPLASEEDKGYECRESSASSIREFNRQAHAAVANLRAEASRLSDAAEAYASPFDPAPSDDQSSQSAQSQDRAEPEFDYDWATFIHAYALGRWDPLRTPQPPRSHLQVPTRPHISFLNGDSQMNGDSGIVFDSPVLGSLPEWQLSDYASSSRDESAESSSSAPSAPSKSIFLPASHSAFEMSPKTAPLPPETGSSKSEKRSNIPLTLPPFSHRLRHSFVDVRTQSYDSPRSPGIPTAEATTAAAALRWAAAHVSVAPLALPSPEHELTDPMRGVTATIPGSHPSDSFVRPDPIPGSPGTIRKSRLSSFWEGTQDVEERGKVQSLPTIHGSPSASPEGSGETEVPPRRPSVIPLVAPLIPPATAPVRHESESSEDDYFGSMSLSVDSSRYDSTMSVSSDQHSVRHEHPELIRQASAPPFDHDPATVPALPRRICLTRQTSAPLPTAALYERRLRSARPASESSVMNMAGRAAKEEHMFSELGYLAPPNPPDELERRRALYKFNIWNTGRDVNFDRLAHLVKLVFNTRIVTLSLVDGTEEFFKSESGLGTQTISRASSFDAHAILQKDDEPMVILDAQDDWRFSKNPLVTGWPNIRFYAGCPLRTQDGFNIGTLSIIDDTPHRDFNPRQRHTLKEFAQVAMRELELWRDKIQLRIRDRIQQSMEVFTRECLEVDQDTDGENRTSMEQVYERAARLVKRTLDVGGSIVMDVSHVDVLETTGSESSMSITIHNADSQVGSVSRILSKEDYAKLADFFEKNPEGKICEGVVPASLRSFLPPPFIQYALIVPIFNIDKRPFALLCAYSTGERTTPSLEGHELSYLRAIGVIILSAVLKRRMILADKAKSLFISNISHELRTPLHGILASAELLSDTPMDHRQASFLHTIQACGTSLVETVNHVLDFTKLSGNARSGGVENAIQLSTVDLMQLVEEATEGCWIGHRARMFTSEIGSVYSPPKQSKTVPASSKHVETVIDIAHNDGGWVFKCEKGGIRRILMNLFGNSLKFTSDGFVHVMLRQLPSTSDTPRNKVRIELCVIDTGKGISQSFLKNQLFHPFSQENPLQTGTGLGLAIVNSIIRSKGIDGKVDVWSAEGVGTEIKVTFSAEAVEDAEASSCDAELVKVYDDLKRPTISLLGFDDPHRGVQLLRTILSTYIVSRWGFTLSGDSNLSDIVLVNEDVQPVLDAIEAKSPDKPFIILSSARGDPRLMAVVKEYERIGGYCRIIYKPVGPCRLHSALKLCLHALNIGQSTRLKGPLSQITSPACGHTTPESPTPPADGLHYGSLPRRYSEEHGEALASRPSLGPRAVTAHPSASWSQLSTSTEENEEHDSPTISDSGVPGQRSAMPTIPVGSGGTLLKSAVGTVPATGVVRVLVVEDNSILRGLLVKWLQHKGYDYREAADGLEGVRAFEAESRFDIVLVDLSMPGLDGIGATAQMRDIESMRKRDKSLADGVMSSIQASRILALTGMSSLEDKRRAFEAGVDGYLVKPVAFKTLDTLFQKLGLASSPQPLSPSSSRT